MIRCLGCVVTLVCLGCSGPLESALEQCQRDYQALARHATETDDPIYVEELDDAPGCGAAMTSDLMVWHLDTIGWDYRQPEKGVFVVSFELNHKTYDVTLTLRRPLGQLDIMLRDIAHFDVLDDSDAGTVDSFAMLLFVTHLNYRNPFVKYAWNRDGGELRAVISLALDDGLTATTLRRYTEMLLRTVVQQDRIFDLVGSAGSWNAKL